MNEKVTAKVNELVKRVCSDSLHVFEHIHGDCNKTHFSHALPYVQNSGMVCEFGVYQGKTIYTLSELFKNDVVYGFDSFEGLPEHWDAENPAGSYTLNGIIPSKVDRGNANEGERFVDWPQNVRLIKGLFEQTLPEFIKNNVETVKFIHIDSDLYSSAKTIFSYLYDRIIPGTVVYFDDWCGYPSCANVDHEVRAFAEFLLDKSYDYIPLSFQTFRTYSQVGFVLK